MFKKVKWWGIAVLGMLVAPALTVYAADKVREGSSVYIEYTLDVDGKPVVTKQKPEYMQLVVGGGRFPAAFEKQLLGMKANSSKNISLEPNQAYGPVRPDLLKRLPKSQLPPGFEPVEGRMLGTKSGGILRVVKVTDEDVIVDQNHPLAGKSLRYTVKVQSIK